MTRRVAITGWGHAVPATAIDNAFFEARIETTDEWIVERTGIRERRVAEPEESTATLAATAARRILGRAGVDPAQLDLIILATATPDQPVPQTAAFLADALGVQCGAMDLGAGCAGFVYALVVGAASVAGGAFDRVLVLGAETLSRIVDPDDRSTVILFGDGAAGVLLEARPDGPGFLAGDLGVDGSAADILAVPAGGSRRPATAETVAQREHYVRMQGQEVFRRAVRAVVESSECALARAGVATSAVDWFVPHQANLRIIEAARQRLGIPGERTIVNIERYGNTSAASIPLALSEAADAGRFGTGDTILLSGFGAGMSWASAVLTWGAA
ncbi:MAG: beta-ketoacyl-ACP synthase III [Actinomycetes bacterium]